MYHLEILPHHSSSTGYCEELWQSHADQDVIGVSTVFVNNAGVKLPQKDMLAEYLAKSSEYYMTAPSPKKKDKKNKTQLTNSGMINQVAVFTGDKGFVCSRKIAGQKWNTQLLGSAVIIDQQFVNNYR